LKSTHGGKRESAGKKKGNKWPSTLAKEAARELAREIITAGMKPILRAQMAHAVGIGHLYTRDKTGKFTRIESEARIDELLTQEREGRDYWIFAKDPSTQAFTDLMNRAIDEPKAAKMDAILAR
jgi:CRISPR/Cas system-associated endonuclease Cas1